MPDSPARKTRRPARLALLAALPAAGPAAGERVGLGIGSSSRTWAWDGRRFALTDATESPCTGFAAGGLAITLRQAALR